MTDLLPCPFCGGTLFTLSNDDRQVKCCECNACGPEPLMVQAENGASLFWAIQKAAIDLWNRRAPSLFERPSIIAKPTVIEAGSMTIGEIDGLHVVFDSEGQRIYDGDAQIWP